jgi:hypothetical protein
MIWPVSFYLASMISAVLAVYFALFRQGWRDQLAGFSSVRPWHCSCRHFR